MAGVWRRTMKYLGLVEEDELEGAMEPELAEEPARRTTSLRRPIRTEPEVRVTTPVTESSVRTIPQAPAASSMIHRAEPKRFNEARDLGEKYKEGVPVIMNLQGTEDTIARRLVDFASGLVFGLDGKIELVATRVYLLTPREVEVSAEERERIREGGFYNQL